MDLFNKFQKVDSAVTRSYTRWGKWIWMAMIAPFIIYGAYIVWAAIWGPPTGPVTLIIHSELDRPVLGFSVNGVGGANSAAHDKNNPYASGPGKSTCCGSVSGKTAEVIWTLSTTRDQYDAGLRKETRRVVMKLPKREWGENYLHVYFFPNDIVRLWWGSGVISPSAEDILSGVTTNNSQE